MSRTGRSRADVRDDRAGSRRTAVLTLLRGHGEPLSIAQISERLAVHPNTARFHVENLVALRLARQVPAVPAGTAGRPAHRFTAVDRPEAGDGPEYRLLAEVLTDYLASFPDRSARGEEAGRQWGERVERPRPETSTTADEQESATDADRDGRRDLADLRALLEEWGFAPVEQSTVTPEDDSEDVTETASDDVSGGAILPGPSVSSAPRPEPEEIRLHACPFQELALRAAPVVCAVHLGMMRGALRNWDADIAVHALVATPGPRGCSVLLHPSECGSTPGARTAEPAAAAPRGLVLRDPTHETGRRAR